MSHFPKLSLESYLTIPHGGWNDKIRIGRKILTRLRCGSNDLRIDTGRWDGLTVDERLCVLCGSVEVETEQHFLLECDHYKDDRIQLWKSLEQLINHGNNIDVGDGRMISSFSMNSLSSHQQLILMMGGYHPSITDMKLQHRVMSKILIAISVWYHQREVFMIIYKDALKA